MLAKPPWVPLPKLADTFTLKWVPTLADANVPVAWVMLSVSSPIKPLKVPVAVTVATVEPSYVLLATTGLFNVSVLALMLPTLLRELLDKA